MYFKKILPLLLAVMAISFSSKAQVTTSNITGVVLNDKNEGLVGANVKATNTQTGYVRNTVTRKDGRYDLTNLNPGGPYTIEVTYVGQTIKSKEGIILTLGNTESVDFYAEGNTTQLEGVVVAGARTSRTLKTGTSTNFGVRQIATVPNISRSITNLTTLTPQAGGGNSFGGRDGRYNNVQIDGSSFNNNFGLSNDLTPGGPISPISIDAIGEISVSVSPFDVRQANFTGAGVNASTRRGTNTFTGSVYGFYRDQSFIGKKANGKDIPPLVESSSKTYGARIGGPIIKNKLFFFINAEKVTVDQPGVNWKATEPGGVADANTSRTTKADLDAVSDYLKTKFGYITGPYQNLGNFITENKKILGRLDWNINSKHSASLRYNYSKTDDDQLLNGTSAPNPRGSSNRWSKNSMSYENSNYLFQYLLSSYSFELKSNFNSKLSNQFLATYTTGTDGRGSNSSIFPFIDIQKDGDNYLSAGYELFTYLNNVETNTLTFNDNVTYNVGKHSLTGGVAYEKIYVKNAFLRYGTSYYRFKSVSDFLTNKAPTDFGLTYPYAGQKPYVELDFAQASAYAQDEISVNNKLKFIFGVRFDRPLFLNELSPNPATTALTFNDLNGNPLKLDVSKWPKERTYFSPRVGFNWDVNGNKNLIIRGGAGIFTGRFPFVWFTNQPSNSGVLQNTVTIRNTAGLNGYLFNPDPYAYIDSFPSQPGSSAPGSIAVVDHNFKMPQVFRLSAAVDKKLGKDWTLTLEGIVNKDINALLQYNANQGNPIGATAGPGSRSLFSSGTRRINSSISEAMVLTNSKKGGAGIITAQIAKRFSNNWDFSVAYTHTEAFDLSGNPGSQAASAWSNIQSVQGNNNLDLAYNDFATPNRVVAYGSYKLNYAKYFATTFTLVYTGYEQGTFSYRYSNDYNQDGLGTNDLIYIPKDASEITFVQNGAFTPAQQSAAFASYVDQDKYLSTHKGQIAKRNGARVPWFSNLDLRVLQDILPLKDKKNYGLQISMEIENFTNMINSDWGVSKRTVYNNGAILAVATAPTATTPATYRMNLVGGQLPTKTFESVITAANTWRMNLGLRLNF